jgi:hypothetical protein
MKKLTITLNIEDEVSIDFVLNYIASSIKKGHTGHENFPVTWKLEEEIQQDSQHSIFVLFETDMHKSKESRIFLGVFESPKIALENTLKNDYSHDNRKIEIVETELNQFKEL